ncbi:YceI family protein [Arenimonas sp. MALMAid1274]|uniref:YceI family protein n=1 Tax=Arenimonas sp. MALMAid1274 TaxID=3411630 RepID=UPI003BA18DDA
MRAIHCLLLLTSLAFTASPRTEAATYRIDPNHSTVVASWEHFGFTRTVLQFSALDGQVVYDPANVGKSSVDVRIPFSGLLTGAPEFRDHLASSQFFDADKFPEARFTSTSVQAAGTGKLKVVGNLTLKGITRPVTLDATLNKAGMQPMARRDAVGFSAKGVIRRSDFDMGDYAPNVSDEVELQIFVEAIVPRTDP